MRSTFITALLVLAACPTPTPVLPATPKISTFTASTQRLTAPGPVTLTWETTDANEVAILDGAHVTVPGVDGRASGSVEVMVQRSSLFVLRATNERGAAASAAVFVEVEGVPAELVFVASPNDISAGDATTLAWSAAGARMVRILDGQGAALDLKGQASFGTVEVRPMRDTRYTLDADGVMSTVDVVVRPVISSLTATPPFAVPGQDVVVRWTTAGATSVKLECVPRGTLTMTSDATQVASGSFTDGIPGATSTSEVFEYRLTASGSTPGVTVSRTLTVYASRVPQITEFLAPQYAELGSTARLSWKTTAERVEILVGGVVVYQTPTTAAATSGSLDVPTPSMTTTYTLKAINSRGGVATLDRTVEPVGPVTVTFNAVPQPGVANGGDPVTLTWSAPNARRLVLSVANQYVLEVINGAAAEGGTRTVYPNAASTEYVITADNGVGAPVTASQTVTVTTPATFTVSPQGPLPEGATVQITGATFTGAGNTVSGLPYVQVNAPGSAFIDIVADGGTSIAYSGPDTTAKLVTLPEVFSTYINGTRVTGDKVSISINGWFVFNASSVSGTDDNDNPLPSAELAPLAIAPYWDDLYDIADSEIFYRLDSVGADRRLIIQWNEVEHDDDVGSSLTFQAQIYSSGKIVFAYQTLSGLTSITPSVGIVGPLELSAVLAPMAPAPGTTFTFFGPQPLPANALVLPFPQTTRLAMPNNAFIEIVFAPQVMPPNQFVVSEVMAHPAAGVTDGEWLELENRTATAFDLQGWTLDFGAGGTHTITTPLSIPANGRVLLGQTATGGDGLAMDYVYGSALNLPDAAGSARVSRAGGVYATLAWTPNLARQGYSVQVDSVSRAGVSYAPGVSTGTCAASAAFGTQGQRGTPGQANSRCPPYVNSTIMGAFTPIAAIGTAVMLTTPTEENVQITLPAPVEAGGTRTAAVTVSTNGYLALKPVTCATATNCFNANRTALNPTTEPFGLIAPFWDNLQPNTAGGIYYARLDPDSMPGSGDEVTIVSWEDFRPSAGTGALNFQVKFFDDGDIEFHYGPMSSTTSGNAAGSSATTWLEDPLGTSAIVINANSSTAPGIAPNSGIRFARQ